MKYSWGYIKELTLAKIDVTQEEASEMGYINKMPYYANEAMSQICSTAKPKHNFVDIEVLDPVVAWRQNVKWAKTNNWFLPIAYNSMTPIRKPENKTTAEEIFWERYNGMYFVNKEIEMPEDFFAFDDNPAEITPYEENLYGSYEVIDTRQAYDDDFRYLSDSSILCYKTGVYRIFYKALWFMVTSHTADDEIFKAPADVINCIPSYIAFQLFKSDDELKAQYFRNEFETMMARLDDTYYKPTESIHIRGGW